VGTRVEGTLKFYYREPKKITETQRSIAHGFAQLLSTQLAAAEMENQHKLAVSMELKMLQTQINPHFLFNTINTIASFIRTDPAKARTLLREFAVFYRRTLEDSTERISLARELDQVQRYFNFELARFGENRLGLEVEAAPELRDMLVPPFLVQPLVENAIKHAMPSEGKLVIRVVAYAEGDDVLIVVSDNGVGMTEETCANITQVESSSTGLGIAVKNVHDRMLGYFGPNAEMVYTSQLGEGTQVTLRCPGCAKSQEASEAEASVLSELPEEENDVLKEGTYSVHREVSEVEGAPYAPLHGEDEEPRMGATADEADKLLAHVSS
jgi:two-component system sensor histidine kinase LytS